MRSIPLVLAIAVLAGCGSPHPATFEQDYDEVIADAEERMENPPVDPSDPASLRRVARASGDAAAELRELEAPSGTEDELTAVVYAMEKVSEAFAAAADQHPDFEAWVGESLEVNGERLDIADDALRAALVQ